MTIVRAKTTTISQQLQPSYAFHHAPWFLLCLWYRWQSKNTNSFQDFHGPEIVLKNLSERTARKIWIGKIFDVDGKVCTGGYAPCTWHRIKDRCLLFATHVPRPSFPSSFIPTNPFINQSINQSIKQSFPMYSHSRYCPNGHRLVRVSAAARIQRTLEPMGWRPTTNEQQLPLG
jgi:hypothetical protein